MLDVSFVRKMGYGRDHESIPLVRGSPSSSQSSSSSGGSVQGKGTISIRAVVHILIFQALIFVVNHAVRENVAFYCTDVLHYGEGGAPKVIDIYDAVSPALPVFGGLIADTLARRYSVIVSGAFITLFGVILLTINVIPFQNVFHDTLSIEAMRALFIIGFTFIFIGLAAYESNVGPFHARQIEARGQNSVRTAFHFLYWSQTLGILFALPLIDWTYRKYTFAHAYGILTATMVIAIIVLMSLGNHYVMIPPDKYAFIQVLHIIYEGFSRRKAPYEDHLRRESFLDHAKESFGGHFDDRHVDEVKHLLKTLPAFHTVTIYSIIIYFMKSTYTRQMLGLNHHVNGGTVPNITFIVYSEACILIFTPLLWFIYHILERFHFTVTPLRRIGFGIVFAGLSVFAAGLVEYSRKTMMPEEPIVNYFGNQSYNASELSALYQLPQLTLGGLAEALVRIAGIEFAFFEAQASLKGFVMGLYILMSGVGSYILAKILVAIVNAASNDTWFPENLNDGHLEKFYYLLTGVALLDLLYLYAVSKNYFYHGWGKQTDSTVGKGTLPNGISPSSTHNFTDSLDSIQSVSGSEASDTHENQT